MGYSGQDRIGWQCWDTRTMRQATLGSRGTGDGIGMIRIGKETLGWLGWEHETQARPFVQTTTPIPINWPRIGLDGMGLDGIERVQLCM